MAASFRAIALVLLATSMTCTAATAQTATKEKVLAAIPKLGKLAQAAVANGGVPGLAIAIVYQDEVVYLGGFGVREMGKPGAVDADTVFQLASFSKPISSTVVASVVSDGLVTWDSRIADLDPAFKLHDAYPTEQVTVRDLFNHRSGLSGNAGNDLEELGFDRATILARLHYLKPTSSFRAGYAYSNFGLTEGAVAAAKPTGKSWEDVSEEKLYQPLGMSSTSSRHADFLKHANRAELHVPVDGKWTALVKRDPDPQSPAGGASSNARDLAQWMRLVLGNGKYEGVQLIKEEAISPTHAPLMDRGKNPVSGAPSFYGLGWNVEFGPVRHGLGACRRFQPGRADARISASLRAARHRGPRQRLSHRRAGGSRRHVLRFGLCRSADGRLDREMERDLRLDVRTRDGGSQEGLRHAPGVAVAGVAARGLCRNLCERLFGQCDRRRGRRRASAEARAERSTFEKAQAFRSGSVRVLSRRGNARHAVRGDISDRPGPESEPSHH
jgi:CubicO group peptidase (beta-lactamase class C family)